jgi:16S rRNA G1207 methylase RsmC
MSYPTVLNEWGIDVTTNDLREDSPAHHHSDFLKATQENIYDVVITNPPFAIAQDIIEKSLQVCKE